MKRILYIGGFRFPNGDAAAARVLNNGKLLKDLGYDVKYLSFGQSKFYEYNSTIYDGFEFEITNDIDTNFTNPFKRLHRFIFSGKNAIQYINDNLETFDIIIAYNPSLYLNFTLQKLCQKYKKKYSIDLTEWYQYDEFPGGYILPFAWMNELNMKVLHNSVNDKILISTYLDKYYHKSNNIILPPLIDSEDQKWNINQKALENFEGIRIIYAGNPSKKDSLDIVIKSVLVLVNKGYSIQLIILGITYSEYNMDIDFSNYTDNIKFLGKVKQDYVPFYYNSSDFSIILRENTRKNNSGFPTKFVESLMASCPVITNLVSDIDKYIIEDENGFIVNDISIDQLTNVFYKILNYNNLNKLRGNARKSAIEKFDYRNYKEKLSNFFEKNN